MKLAQWLRWYLFYTAGNFVIAELSSALIFHWSFLQCIAAAVSGAVALSITEEVQSKRIAQNEVGIFEALISCIVISMFMFIAAPLVIGLFFK